MVRVSGSAIRLALSLKGRTVHQIKPTVVFAGTPRDRLAEGLANVANALEAAERLMGEATPNGRDYHDQSLWSRDRAESDRRLKIIEELKNQFWREAIEVQE